MDRPYSIIKVTPGTVIDNYPYVQPPPYPEEAGSRRSVALSHGNASSQAAVSQLSRQANSFKTLILLLECADNQLKKAASKPRDGQAAYATGEDYLPPTDI